MSMFIDPVDDCPWRPPREIFSSYGYQPLAPDQLSNSQLPGRLWELLYAAAGRRFFFHHTNHLSDRELYTMLWREWLDEPIADIPLEAETNTNLSLSEFDHNGLTSEEIWLRYYADAQWRFLESSEVLPPHEDPPFDRDRFLPISPIPREMHSGWLPGDDENIDNEELDEDDPLGLAAADREIAAAKIDNELGRPHGGDESDADLEAILGAMEPDSWTPPAKELSREIPLLPPAEITDDMLGPILWELLHNLALRGFFVLHSNHLSDRELYAELWERGLRDPAMLPGRNLRGGWFHDILGSWGDDEMRLWLRYYATAAEREKYALEYPAESLPASEKPIAQRDWRLPKGPFD